MREEGGAAGGLVMWLRLGYRVRVRVRVRVKVRVRDGVS